MTSCVVGIDPGKNGALVVLSKTNACTMTIAMPVVGEGKGSRVDADAVRRIFDDLEAMQLQPVLVCIEKVGGHMGDSPSSAFEFGRALGVVEAVVAIKGLRVEYVEPQRWQMLLLKGKPRRTYAERKRSAAVVAAELFPNTEWRRQCGDALLIAEFARQLAHHKGLL